MKPSKLLFHRQETEDSCVPACLKMVIASFGHEVSEVELRRLCDCTFDGTSALKAVDALRSLGFIKTSKQSLTIEELETVVANGVFPIVFVDLTPIDGVYQSHAFVITEMNLFSVKVLDPAIGERLIPRDVFYMAWKLQQHLTILVER